MVLGEPDERFEPQGLPGEQCDPAEGAKPAKGCRHKQRRKDAENQYAFDGAALEQASEDVIAEAWVFACQIGDVARGGGCLPGLCDRPGARGVFDAHGLRPGERAVGGLQADGEVFVFVAGG